MGLFVTFEGIEGCGKTTQVKLALEHLKNRGIPCVMTQEPGGTPLGNRIRQLLLNQGSFEIGPRAEALLFCAARAQHVEKVIRPALGEGKVVLCDRFADATIAYQGYGRQLGAEDVQKIIDFASGTLKPDLTLLFDVPVEAGLERALRRISRNKGPTPEDRFEREALAFHHRIRAGYLALAEREPGRFRVLDGSRDIAAVHRDVRDAIDRAIGR